MQMNEVFTKSNYCAGRITDNRLCSGKLGGSQRQDSNKVSELEIAYDKTTNQV